MTDLKNYSDEINPVLINMRSMQSSMISAVNSINAESLNEFNLTSAELKTIIPDVNLDSIQDYVKPFEIGLSTVINNVSNGLNESDYNSLAYDRLLERGVDYLGRAIAIRDDGKEFTLRYFNELLERFEEANDILHSAQEIGIGGFVDQQLTADGVLVSAYREAAEGGDGHDEKRTIAEAENLASVNKIRTNRLTVSRNRLLQRANIARFKAHQLSIPGGALNFEERIGQLSSAFQENVLEAFWLLTASAQGMKDVFPALKADATAKTYEVFKPFPIIDPDNENGFADKLLEWARHASFVLHRELNKSQDFRVFYVVGSSVTNEKMLKDRLEDISTAKGAVFTVEQNDFAGFNNLRVQSVRVLWMDGAHNPSAGHETFAQTQRTYSGSLKPPKLATGTQPPTFHFADALSNVTIYEEQTIEPSLRNCNPIGEWKLKLYKDANWKPTSPSNLRTVIIEMIVSGVAND